MNILLDSISALLGLAFGSFTNVVIFRNLSGRRDLRASSACVNCGAKIQPRDNIPLLSWLLLRGKCRNCGSQISPIYFVVEATAAILFVAFRNLPNRISSTANFEALIHCLPLTVGLWWFSCASIALAVIDFKQFRLPSRIIFTTFSVVFIAFAATAFLEGAWDVFMRAILGSLLSIAFFGVIHRLFPRGMGLGDVKLAGLLGLLLGWFGWGALIVGSIWEFLLGSAFGLLLISLQRAKSKSVIAFGPWMLAGTILGIFFGEQVWQSYLSLLHTAVH